MKGDMQKVLIMTLLAGCSAYPSVNWPAGAGGIAPALLPIDEVLGPEASVSDASGAALAAEAAALQARAAAMSK
jgi:hypothetical protein